MSGSFALLVGGISIKRRICCFISICLIFCCLAGCVRSGRRVVSLEPFSASVSFPIGEKTYVGLLEYESPHKIRLLFRSPASLTGLCAEREDGKTLLRMGETAADLDSASLLFGTVNELDVLLGTLASLGALPLELDAGGTARLVTESGDVTAAFDGDSRLQTLEIENTVFRFSHDSSHGA